MKIRLILLLGVCLQWMVFSASGQGTVTITGGGNGSYTWAADLGQASAGTFEGLTDTQIMEHRGGADYSLLPHWVPFTPWVQVGGHLGGGGMVGIPEDPDTGFSFQTSQTLAAESPFKGKPVYVVVRWQSLLGGSSAVVVHKTTGVFPADGSNAVINVKISMAQPRLLVGKIFSDSSAGIPVATVSPASRDYANWAFAWFGDAATTPEAQPGVDPDGDGQTNEEERQTATNPRDVSSRFELQWTGPPTPAGITFQWPTRPGYYYAVMQSDTPVIPRPATRPASAVQAQDFQMTQTIPAPADAPRRFFAVFYWDR